MKATIAAISLLAGAMFLALAVFLHGVALHHLWGWYIVPTFNAPPLSWAQAAGVTMTVQLILPRRTPPSRDQDKREVAITILWPVVALLIGWMLHGWA